MQAYAYNEASGQRVYPGPIARVEVTPTRTGAIDGGTVLSEAAIEGAASGTAEADITASAQAAGDGTVTADVINPGLVTGDEYRVEFYEYCVDDGTSEAGKQGEEEADDIIDPSRSAFAAKRGGTAAETCYTAYDIINVTTGETVFDGRVAVDATGEAPPIGQGVQVIDGLSFNVLGPNPGALEIDGTLGFVEIVGPDGIDPCSADAASTAGCDVFGGNFVYPSFNGDGTYIMYHEGDGPEFSLGGYAPNDYEIRFTEEGGYGVFAFSSDDNVNEHIPVPFEVWDIGITGVGNENDPSDDVRLIPVLFSDSTGNSVFAYGELPDPFGLEASNGATDRVYAYYPVEGSTYDDWEAIVQPNVEAAADNVWTDADGAQQELIDFDRGRPIQRVIFVDATGDPTVEHPGVGAVVRLYTTKPNLPGDQFVFSTDSLGAAKGNQQTAREMLDQIGIVPNPYKGASAYEVSQLTDQVRFTNMPDRATIRIYTLAGTLIRTLRKESPGVASFPWDLNTEEGLPVASGMYLIHVDVPDVGERVLKFGVVTKEKKLNTF